MARIYLLADPVNHRPMYVGRTGREVADRITSHFTEAEEGHWRRRSPWLRNLRKRGQFPLYIILEECSENDRDRRELWWINVFFGRLNGWPNQGVNEVSELLYLREKVYGKSR